MIADWRQAIRSLRRSPTFAATAIATLAFGIGATSAIFTIVNAALFKPLPYPNPEELVDSVAAQGSGTGWNLRARDAVTYVRDQRATATLVLRRFLSEGMAVASFGLVAGLIGAASVSRVLATLLFGVAPLELQTFASVLLLLLVVATLATLLPSLGLRALTLSRRCGQTERRGACILVST
jgi:hypothetical protein